MRAQNAIKAIRELTGLRSEQRTELAFPPCQSGWIEISELDGHFFAERPSPFSFGSAATMRPEVAFHFDAKAGGSRSPSSVRTEK